MKHDKLGCLHPLIFELPEPEHGPAAPPHLLQQQQRGGMKSPRSPQPALPGPAPASLQGLSPAYKHTGRSSKYTLKLSIHINMLFF